MSIQLIVFPQSYEGSPNPLAANSTQFSEDDTIAKRVKEVKSMKL